MASPKRSGKALAAPRPVESLIHVIRSHKVMLDRDLATLYGVKTIALRQQVKRNEERFPADFMFRLTAAEAERLVSQSVIPSRRSLGGFLPYVFTQEGVAMLSSVVRSPRAVQMNIDIMRAFVRLRQMIENSKDIAARVEKLERSHDRTASVIEVLVEDIDRVARELKDMKALPPVTKRKIGFRLGEDD
ncbi:MAG: ORF6N domain-containing protein [Deltaproteobacteria bacterium]|nr:ORF6N domain-containing protein [Deltaproteobacteria bacterium]